MNDSALKQAFWVSWYGYRGVGFCLDSPWWISGSRQDPQDEEREQNIICAAVRADSEEEAMSLIVKAHDKPVSIDWRFCAAQKPDWSPFNSRFRRADWMKWA